MSEKTIELSFDGYYQQNEDKNEERLINAIKRRSGVYVVYIGKPTKPSKCSIDRLIYIGESENIYERLTKNHEHYKDWINELGQGDRLYFSIADVDDGDDDRKRAEAALIYKIKPKINAQGVDSFNYDQTTVKSSGKANNSIPDKFTAYRS